MYRHWPHASHCWRHAAFARWNVWNADMLRRKTPRWRREQPALLYFTDCRCTGADA
jgi:hypothetical protein